MEGMLIGGQVKAARKLKGVKTTKDLADLVSQPRFGDKVIGQIERNQRRAQPHEIAWLASALKVPENYLTDPAEVDEPAHTADATLKARLDRIDRRLDRIEELLRRLADAATDRSAQSARQWVAGRDHDRRLAPERRETTQDPGAAG